YTNLVQLLPSSPARPTASPATLGARHQLRAEPLHQEFGRRGNCSKPRLWNNSKTGTLFLVAGRIRFGMACDFQSRYVWKRLARFPAEEQIAERHSARRGILGS